MNNRGFTLIELTGIVLVLAAIFLLTFPALLNTTRADKEKEYNVMVENLCKAGETYIYSHMGDYDELNTIDSVININISELILYGNVDKNTINPNTNKNVDKDVLEYKVTLEGLDCNYKEE